MSDSPASDPVAEARALLLLADLREYEQGPQPEQSVEEWLAIARRGSEAARQIALLTPAALRGAHSAFLARLEAAEGKVAAALELANGWNGEATQVIGQDTSEELANVGAKRKQACALQLMELLNPDSI